MSGSKVPDLCVIEPSPLGEVLYRYKPSGIISPKHPPSHSSRALGKVFSGSRLASTSATPAF